MPQCIFREHGVGDGYPRNSDVGDKAINSVTNIYKDVAQFIRISISRGHCYLRRLGHGSAAFPDPDMFVVDEF